MQRDRYILISDPAHSTYEFLSAGPNGTIKKVVQFTAIGPTVYNLGFGDWDEKEQRIRDDVRSNNGDLDRVLATVAFAAIDFMEHHHDAIIFAIGSTAARTRLYQMGIAYNLLEINQFFEIEGFYNGVWESFKRGRNYQAFSLRAK
jgi:hypothetical protein